jgi:hypothetical protein
VRRAAIPILVACAACSAQTGGSGGPPNVVVVDVREVGRMAQSSSIAGRDGGESALLFQHSVWAFGDTVLRIQDTDGQTWHHNSFSITDDLTASGGILGLSERTDAAGAPLYFLAPTEDEAAFNRAHLGSARWAVWPGAMVFDAPRERAFIFYGLVYAQPGDFNFRGVGQSIAVWSAFDSLPERPELSPGTDHPTLLFGENERAFGTAAAVEGEFLYVFACDKSGLSFPCAVARVESPKTLDRNAWRYFDGAAWSPSIDRAANVLDGAPIMGVHFNAYLRRWVAIHSVPLSNEVVLETAESLEGPWSSSLPLFSADRKGMGGTSYDALPHAELAEDGGRIEYVTYSRPTGTGLFDAEFAVVRVQLSVK